MPTDLISRLYSRLLRLYPAAHRERFSEPMRQTFADLRREAKLGRNTYLAAFADTAAHIAAEHFRSTPAFAALTGMACFGPFFLLNLIVVFRLEPYITWLRPDTHSNPLEWTIIVIALLLMPAGAYLSVQRSSSRNSLGHLYYAQLCHWGRGLSL
jgi:hypothetical protein